MIADLRLRRRHVNGDSRLIHMSCIQSSFNTKINQSSSDTAVSFNLRIQYIPVSASMSRDMRSIFSSNLQADLQCYQTNSSYSRCIGSEEKVTQTLHCPNSAIRTHVDACWVGRVVTEACQHTRVQQTAGDGKDEEDVEGETDTSGTARHMSERQESHVGVRM